VILAQVPLEHLDHHIQVGSNGLDAHGEIVDFRAGLLRAPIQMVRSISSGDIG
jgi:hypothetical protein